MKISYYCSRRGHGETAWDDFLAAARKDGYDGVETGLPSGADEREALLRGWPAFG
ncbi:hypothetical protein ACQ86N_00395 [Puia sp. P3]|uniref:hypothetical protein n=1 Tax=Puia sp. P3 TaxID=3423952 RepID=UPI003D670792